MYGIKKGQDLSDRTIVLMACNGSSTDKAVPNLILVSKEYRTHTGETVSIDECWDMFNRYVDRMCESMPGESRKEIPRACFYGIDSLKDLLSQQDCAGIQYHFGYNPATEHLPKRYEAVMEAVKANRQSLDVYMEQGQLCPTLCPPGTVIPDIFLQRRSEDLKAGHEWLQQFRESQLLQDTAGGALYEMYYNVSPSLIEAIQRLDATGERNDGNIDEQQFSACIAQLKRHLPKN